ncbi:TIGR03571 family LLM class oxidoreductase [Natronolimnohabitans innermongolicus]|uniref:Luciferase-type oxidoreductase n=1 Tax=Natronolimnohabitans innermongolicus JCM 12255 TaxID=1227499 RepID=L9WV11_9EURY|nr:TIGR03571 family LLM class oxidoreductase [Natronolimnohabitans innermongolicus]ELY53262.1 luciferase-type oxidoreductase [Natronolimnohabitans innermongolicus JCM 12255]
MPTRGHENAGYRRLFDDDGLSFGVGFPLTGANRSTPDVAEEIRLARHAESVGFDGLWVRDVPTYWPKFGDAGQTFDAWPWLSQVAAHTDDIALGTSSIVLTLRHPIHVAKSAATVDRLSDGRLVMGVASGDRDPEFDAFDVDRENRGRRFRERFEAIRACWREEYPELEGEWGRLEGDLDVVPKPTAETIPLLPTGNSRQSDEWIAANGDGWLFYHLPESTLESYLADWRERAGEKPFAIAIRVELADDPTAGPEPLHLGFHAGIEWFREYFRRLEGYGLDHAIVGIQNEDRTAALSTFADEIAAKL